MRPIKFNENAQAYRERVAELAKQRRLVKKPGKLERVWKWLTTPLW